MLKLALSACFFHADPERRIFKGKTLQYLEQSLAHWLMREGNHVFMLPSPPKDSDVPYGSLVSYDEALRSMAEDFDGLVLQGGSDVSPTTYGEEPLRLEWGGDAIRDRYEIALMKTFLAQKKPVLGICRGAQLMNVGFGGTLHQDIETQVPGALVHRNWEIYDQLFHEIRMKDGSGLARLYGPGPHKINTVHHQAIKTLGEGLRAEAVSPEDGIIEAIRHEGEVYAFAVQWHPEFHDRTDPTLIDDQKILHEYMEACRLARAGRQARAERKKEA